MTTGLVYVLRAFPCLSETFVRREIEAVRAAGTHVSVIALGRGEGADLVDGVTPPEGRPPVAYVGAGSAVPLRHPCGPWARAVGKDLTRLAARPRRAARAARLALQALRAASAVPPGTTRLHAHFANDAAALARYTGALTGLPYTVTAHAWDIWRDPFLLAPNLAGAARVFTVSRANLEHLREGAAAGGWDRDRLELLHCGVDLAALAYRDPSPLTGRAARLVCVARLVPKKGHDLLLDAFERLRARGVQAELLIAGDGSESANLRARVAASPAAPSVRLLGAVEPARALELIASADLCVLAARVARDGDRDGLPVALIEAAALGPTLVATKVGGIPELVTPATGWLVPPDDAAALAAGLHAALSAPHDDRLRRARAARRLVEAEFDLRRQAERIAR